MLGSESFLSNALRLRQTMVGWLVDRMGLNVLAYVVDRLGFFCLDSSHGSSHKVGVVSMYSVCVCAHACVRACMCTCSRQS